MHFVDQKTVLYAAGTLKKSTIRRQKPESYRMVLAAIATGDLLRTIQPIGTGRRITHQDPCGRCRIPKRMSFRDPRAAICSVPSYIALG
jgi:hypothetical protein